MPKYLIILSWTSAPFFPHWKALWLSRDKWLLINLPSLVAFSLRRTQCQFDLRVILNIREWVWEWRNIILSSSMTTPQIVINLTSYGHRVCILQVCFILHRKSVLWYTDLTIVTPLIINDLKNPCFEVVYIL